MRRLIYTSIVAPLLLDQDALLASILKASVPNNADVAVTGMLLLYRQHFIQVLEGPAEGVEAIYRKVRRDSRHQHLKLIEDATTPSRSFAGWAMCGCNIGSADNEILEVLALRRGFEPREISGFGALSLLRTVRAVQQRVALRDKVSIVIEA